jgi:hypothetical protein
MAYVDKLQTRLAGGRSPFKDRIGVLDDGPWRLYLALREGAFLWRADCSLILVAVGFLEITLREAAERVCRLAIQRATRLD